MANYTTIIFDLDGTLVNTLPDLTESINYTFKRFNLPEKTPAEIRSALGFGYSGLLERTIPGGTTHPHFNEIFYLFKTYYTAHCRLHTQLYPGILSLLDTLEEKGYKLAIVSNKNELAVQEIKHFYFDRYNPVVVGERAQLKRKPAPDMVWQALHKLRSHRHESIYIGDSEVDKQTADNAGLDCILVTWGFRDKKQLAPLDPSCLVDSTDEILTFLTQ